MPRLSLWRSEKSNDYRFFDRTISEMFTVGATDLYVHKYIGANNHPESKDVSQPHYDKLDPTNIQDLLFLENRDRKYDNNIYRLRGHYNVQNLDFDLSQFGLFLTNDVIFITVHYNDMIDVIGRKLMVGDVFELPHLTDYHPLNDTIPIGLRRYYQITDANFASEGFSSTWWPHLWRIKCEPLVDSQEFANILQKPINQDNHLGDYDKTKTYPEGYTVTHDGKVYVSSKPVPIDTPPPEEEYWTVSTENTLLDILSRYNANLEVNNAALAEASRLVPKSGYDTSQLYVLPTVDGSTPANPVDIIFDTSIIRPKPYIATFFNPELNVSNFGIVLPNSNNPSPLNIQVGMSIMMQYTEMAAPMTEGGSGPMVNDTGLTVTLLPNTSSPYGTTDNTFAQADQSVSLIMTAYMTAPNVSIVEVVDIPNTVSIGLKVKCTVFNDYGLPESVFDSDTFITAIDPIAKRITLSNPTKISIPAGHPVEVAYDFTGTVSQDINYQSDTDPKFQYIKRFTPRSYGYIAGYLSGTGEAPNGEPVRSGTSFPSNPQLGEYFLRLDYLPQKLFRWDGKLWVGISSKVRTEPGIVQNDESLLSGFINNNSTIKNVLGEVVKAKQSLSKALKIKPD